jgi:sec-independent protein translocase protein TatC
LWLSCWPCLYIYQLWAFVKPALYEKEKSLATPLLIGSIALFYAGVAFAYFIACHPFCTFLSVFPLTLWPHDRHQQLSQLLSKTVFGFGLTFEIPIVTLILILIGVVSTTIG